jgi:hypothetical protein
MDYPSNTLFKSALVSLSLVGLLGNYDLGERTLDRDEAQTVTLERNMKASDERTDTLASCIAQPSDWAEPSSVVMSGTAQVQESPQAFNVAASRYTEGEAIINPLQALQGYTWYCYTDEARDYDAQYDENYIETYADTGKVSYTLTPEADDALVYTTIGMIDGGWDRRATQYLYKEMASHQLLKNNVQAVHFEKLASHFSEEGFNPVNQSFDIFKHNNSVYFIGYKGKALITNMDGEHQVVDVPVAHQFYLLNDQFIAFKEEYTEDSWEVASTSIQYSSDLITWSGPKDVSILNNVYSDTLNYDPKNALYVVLNTATTQGQERIYFTSPDLENWTANTVGIWQNHRTVFAEDGRALMSNYTAVDSLMSRTANGEWQSFAHYPETGNDADTEYYLNEQDTIFANDRFHVLLQEYSRTVVNEENVTTYLKSHIGYSDDLITWNWATINGDEETIQSLTSLTALAENQIAISGGQYSYRSLEHFYISHDNGGSWNPTASPIGLLSLAESVDTSNFNYIINSLINHNGTTYGKLSVSGENDFKNELYFSTTNFSDFNLELVANDSELFTFNNALYLNSGAYSEEWGNYRKIEATEIEQRAAIKAIEDEALAASETAIAAAATAVAAAQTASEALSQAQDAQSAVEDASSDTQKAEALEAAQEAKEKAQAAVEEAQQAASTALAASQSASQLASQAGTEAATQAASNASAALASADQAVLLAEESLQETEQAMEAATEAANEDDETGIASLGFMELFLLMLVAFGLRGRNNKAA